MRRHVLSARIEATCFGHLMAVLSVGAQLPHQGCDTEDDDAEDGRVGLPVGRLRIPTTGRRPDVLGVARRGRCRLGIRGATRQSMRSFFGAGNSRDLCAAALQWNIDMSKLRDQLGGKYIPL